MKKEDERPALGRIGVVPVGQLREVIVGLDEIDALAQLEPPRVVARAVAHQGRKQLAWRGAGHRLHDAKQEAEIGRGAVAVDRALHRDGDFRLLPLHGVGVRAGLNRNLEFTHVDRLGDRAIRYAIECDEAVQFGSVAECQLNDRAVAAGGGGFCHHFELFVVKGGRRLDRAKNGLGDRGLDGAGGEILRAKNDGVERIAELAQVFSGHSRISRRGGRWRWRGGG